MTTGAIVAISVLAYLVAGMATATMVVLIEGEPKPDDQWVVIYVVLLWPFFLLIDLPICVARGIGLVARWIKRWRESRCEKPRAFAEDYER
jgi:Zn-dependent protease with chaperone function